MNKEDFNLTNIVQESDERSECKFTDDELIRAELANKDELVQEDFSSCGCVDKGHDWQDKPIPKSENMEHHDQDGSLRGRLRIAAEVYYKAKQELGNHQASLWLSTDFKAEGCTNDSMRKAFITHESEDETRAYYDAKVDYDDVKREYELKLAELRKKEMIFV
jgi:hypothetical protein